LKDNINEIEHIDALLVAEVSDEGLEASATIENGAYTLLACTGLSECPA
jgi:hypothetical protein